MHSFQFFQWMEADSTDIFITSYIYEKEYWFCKLGFSNHCKLLKYSFVCVYAKLDMKHETYTNKLIYNDDVCVYGVLLLLFATSMCGIKNKTHSIFGP